MKVVPLFNPTGSDAKEDRLIIGGNPTNLFNLNDFKYTWAKDLYKIMRFNQWFPERVDMTSDIAEYAALSPLERHIFDNVISFLSFLDSLQFNNLPRISDYITASEVKAAIQMQATQETIHSESYQYVLESVVDPESRDAVLEKWRTNPDLLKRNTHIAEIFNAFWDEASDANFADVLIANYLLEGLYFYNGFIFFYTLAFNNKMRGTSEQIRYINRDEHCFVEGTEILTPEGFKDFRELSDASLVAQYDLNSKEVSFVKPEKRVVKEYEGDMYRVFNKTNYESVITPDHDFVYRNAKTNVQTKKPIKDFKFNSLYNVPVSGFKSEGSLTELDCIDQLLIALQADGHINKGRTGVIMGCQVLNFNLTRPRKIKRLTSILEACLPLGVTYSSCPASSSSEEVTFYIHYPNTLPKRPDKEFSWVNLSDVTYEYGRAFIQELQHWDGHVDDEHNSIYYSNTNKLAVDKVQALCALSGVVVTRGVQQDFRKDTYKDVHRLWMFLDADFRGTQRLQKEIIDYKGKVYCVTVPTGAIVVRYKNTVTISGNCHRSLFANIINTINAEKPGFFSTERIIALFTEAIEHEITWINSIYTTPLLGVDSKTVEDYTYFLVEGLLHDLNIENPFPKRENPYQHLDSIINLNQDSTKSNFFEATVGSYNQSSVLEGWDEI